MITIQEELLWIGIHLWKEVKIYQCLFCLYRDVILMVLQSMYNKYMMEISNPEVRQLFTQLRDSKMKNISQLQQEIKTMIDQGKA